MALCMRRLRWAPGLSGVRGAGGAAGRLREASRIRDAILYRELRPSPRVSAPLRRAPTVTTITLSPRAAGVRLSSPSAGLDRAPQSLLLPLPATIKLSDAPSLFGKEYGHLSSAQLDCFRSLFEAGVCRTPFQVLAFPTPAAAAGLLEFSKSAASQISGSHQPGMEQHLAVMYEKLREELPKFLLTSVNITLYRKDVEFISSLLHIHLRGLVKYQLFLNLTRFLLLCYYINAQISILKLTSHPETNSIHARWSFTGMPLHCLLLYLFKSNKNELYRTYDAFSTFQLAPDGLISVHKLERVMPSSPLPMTKKTIVAAALIALGLVEDRPALNLLSSPKLPHEL